MISQVGFLRRSRTFLAVPLRQQGELIGSLIARRIEVRPFTPAQIKLLETFADQAVIAIENVRLFNELKESLEQQTATSEILGVIASSPTDIQPVLDVVAENAARLCDAKDACISRFDSDGSSRTYGFIRVNSSTERDSQTSRNNSCACLLGEHSSIGKRFMSMTLATEIETEFPDSRARQQFSGDSYCILRRRCFERVSQLELSVIRRTEVRPFSDEQIKLLETFADQAVIAIENVRLFQELKESLEQQTATSEILGVIASSPTDIQPVLDVVAENARGSVRQTMHRFYGSTVTFFGWRPHYGSLNQRRHVPSIGS